MAGLLDSARDFERWLAAIEAKRPISHPQPLDPDEMYWRYLEQKMQQAAPPYQAAQMPAALAELSAMSPHAGTGQWGQPRAPVGLAGGTSPTPFAFRMTGPQSRNLEDERTPITADTVANWLSNPHADDQDWRSTWIGGGNGFLPKWRGG